jgi:tetratricopeptide (TPR) repeat protein
VKYAPYIFLIAMTVLFRWAPSAFSDEFAGTEETIGFASARLLALGGVSAAVDTGTYSLGHNPATLSLNPIFGFSFTERALPAPSAHRITAGTTTPVNGTKNLALVFDDKWISNIEGYDSYGNPTGTFSYHDRTFAAGYAQRFAKILAIGGDLRYRRIGYADSTYSAALADVGIVVNPIPREYTIQKKYGVLTLGASLNDLYIKGFDYPSGDFKSNLDLSLGAAWSKEFLRTHEITVAWEHSTANEGPFNLGFEYTYAYTAHWRIGHNGVVPTFGIGLSQNLFDFDYALVKKETGFEHTVTFSLFPGRDVRAETQKKHTIETWLNEGRAYYETGNYDLALRRFKNVLEWDENNETATRYFVEAKYEGYLQEGRKFLDEGNWERASRAFNAALNVMPGDFLAKQYLIRTAYMEEESTRFAAVETRVAEVLKEIEKLNARGLYRNSIILLTDSLNEIPDREELKQALLITRRLLAAAETSEVPTEEPPKVIPNAVRIQYEKADELLTSGNVTDAINILEPIVSKYPHYYEASSRLVESYMYRGLDLYSNGYLESALAYWRKILAVDPDNAKAKRYVERTEAEIKAIRGGN